eukprot:CAMPEP_0119104092 /NCGR_PEP_ID=MMETSP1180-20130426/2399_1 /TAXON_ID=3052 ORGANISM="Chlamydomonas cf sp, Strain CCMP681" /NCGR_SAMPLE_ID=MMETSP1180 /ASSEMBLY_ACC=CAM_ASM_000741 /LENGTH=138 /DNA_ID=CAMNT_0007088765 /DNA_START=546 /DNA_END=963 /DNA_ORIENTATION=+
MYWLPANRLTSIPGCMAGTCSNGGCDLPQRLHQAAEQPAELLLQRSSTGTSQQRTLSSQRAITLLPWPWHTPGNKLGRLDQILYFLATQGFAGEDQRQHGAGPQAREEFVAGRAPNRKRAGRRSVGIEEHSLDDGMLV